MGTPDHPDHPGLRDQDVRIDIGRSATGAFIRVLHLPTGLSFTDETQRVRTIAVVRAALLQRLRDAVAARR